MFSVFFRKIIIEFDTVKVKVAWIITTSYILLGKIPFPGSLI